MKPVLSGLETMTPLERVRLLFQGEAIDRPPVDLFLSDIKAKFIGRSISEYWWSEEDLVLGEIVSFNRFGMDFVGVGPSLYAAAEAMGTRLKYSGNLPVTVESYALGSIEEVGSLDAFQMTKHLRIFYRAVQRLRDIFDNLCPVVVSLPGPMTMASLLLGTEKFLKDMRKKPAETELLIGCVVEGLKTLVSEFGKEDVLFGISDPAASTNLISPKNYAQYAFPATCEISEHIMRVSSYPPSYHVCGSTGKIWPVIAQLPIGIFSIDNAMDLKEACHFFSNSKIIAGNVDPVGVICHGNQDLIGDTVAEVLRQGKSCVKGFVLAPGCDIPFQTSVDNIDYFVRIAKSKV